MTGDTAESSRLDTIRALSGLFVQNRRRKGCLFLPTRRRERPVEKAPHSAGGHVCSTTCLLAPKIRPGYKPAIVACLPGTVTREGHRPRRVGLPERSRPG